MHTHPRKSEKWISRSFQFIAVVMIVIALSVPLPGYAAQAGERVFASPEEAVKALISAVKTDNMKELAAIFGPPGRQILSSGDPVEDRAGRERFLNAYEMKNALILDGDAKAVLQIGEEGWPFPIPVVKRGQKWSFDARKGKEELINRRIGRNELDTLQTCLAYVDAQREYTQKDMDKDGFYEYAQKFVSTPGKKDGLYWEAKPGEEESPLGDFSARATREGYRKTSERPIPYHGYFFKILKAQGKNAPGGAYDYLIDGKMIGGFALVAYPTQYGVSGVMTFIVNHEGVVCEKNLGRNTAKIARAMKAYDPEESWKQASAAMVPK